MPSLENLKTLFPLFRVASFGCGAGWYDLLMDAGIDLSAYAQRHRLNPSADSVRSKFGELRIDARWPGATERQLDEIEDILADYAAASKGVCETCGRRGRRVTVDRAVFTLCREHHHARRCNP